MTAKELAKKVALLKDGQHVEIDGLMFKAIKMTDDDCYVPCFYCNVDCLCRDNVTEVCKGLDSMSKSDWYLYLLND